MPADMPDIERAIEEFEIAVHNNALAGELACSIAEIRRDAMTLAKTKAALLALIAEVVEERNEAVEIVKELADHTPHYWNFGWNMQIRIRKLLSKTKKEAKHG